MTSPLKAESSRKVGGNPQADKQKIVGASHTTKGLSGQRTRKLFLKLAVNRGVTAKTAGVQECGRVN